MKTILWHLKTLNILKTIYFNFHYFPFKTAIKIPIYIYRRSELYKMQGKIEIDAPVATGMVDFGSHCLGQDLLYSRTMWEVAGTLIIKGKTSIGRGSKISIGIGAVLTLGCDFKITGDTQIICQKSISFGNDCLLSWDILIMDTDFHNVYDEKGEIINSPRPITIGDHVWIGCRNTILKGVYIASESIISANSTITKSFHESNCIIGGQGKSAYIIKRGINWEEK